MRDVAFYVSYTDHAGGSVGPLLVGEDGAPPYEVTWNCADIPDQNLGKLSFTCRVTDNAGNVSTRALGEENDAWSRFVLDRDPAASANTLTSRWTDEVVIDGRFTEWTSTDSLQFKNNDNIVTACSMWNGQGLYLAVHVRDRSIIDHYVPGQSGGITQPIEDVIELYLDTGHDRHEICTADERHYLISPRGFTYRSVYYDIGASRKMRDVDVAVVLDGTVNDQGDDDGGYSLELAIPWDQLGTTPERAATMGLEILNCDKDFETGSYFFSGWTTTQAGLKNPSQWGAIVLDERPRSGSLMLFGGLALMFIVAGFGVYRLRLATSSPAPMGGDTPLTPEDGVIGNALEYIREHYSDPGFSRDSVAGEIGMTPSHFGKYFKKETRETFTDHVNTLRMEEARRLLVETRRNISEISLSVGFENPSYFCALFRKREGVSPSAYRKTHRHRR